MFLHARNPPDPIFVFEERKGNHVSHSNGTHIKLLVPSLGKPAGELWLSHLTLCAGRTEGGT